MIQLQGNVSFKVILISGGARRRNWIFKENPLKIIMIMHCWQSCRHSFQFKRIKRVFFKQRTFVCVCLLPAFVVVRNYIFYQDEEEKNDKLIPLRSRISIYFCLNFCFVHTHTHREIVIVIAVVHAVQKEFFWHLEWILFSFYLSSFYSSSNIETK